MSWIDEALPLFRVLIGDDESPYVYCDERLTDILVSSAKMVNFELSFDTVYTITISTSTISPDPSDDPFFIPLMCLRAASSVANGEYKAAAASSVSVGDGPASVDFGGTANALKARMEALKGDYAQAKLQYMVGNAIGCGAVLSNCLTVYKDYYKTGWTNYRNIGNDNYYC